MPLPSPGCSSPGPGNHVQFIGAPHAASSPHVRQAGALLRQLLSLPVSPHLPAAIRAPQPHQLPSPLTAVPQLVSMLLLSLSRTGSVLYRAPERSLGNVNQFSSHQRKDLWISPVAPTFKWFSVPTESLPEPGPICLCLGLHATWHLLPLTFCSPRPSIFLPPFLSSSTKHEVHFYLTAVFIFCCCVTDCHKLISSHGGSVALAALSFPSQFVTGTQPSWWCRVGTGQSNRGAGRNKIKPSRSFVLPQPLYKKQHPTTHRGLEVVRLQRTKVDIHVM